MNSVGLKLVETSSKSLDEPVVDKQKKPSTKKVADWQKNKSEKKETEKLVNPETGEPLLQVGVAYKHLKDKMAKEKAAEADRKEKKSSYDER